MDDEDKTTNIAPSRNDRGELINTSISEYTVVKVNDVETTTTEKYDTECQELGCSSMELSTLVVGHNKDEKTTAPKENVESEEIEAIGMELSTLVVGGDDIDNPTPLCVVRSDKSTTTTSGMAIVGNMELIIDESYMEPDSKFGISPFTLNLAHKDAPLHCQLLLETELKTQSIHEKKRTWYRHSQHPEIEITGEMLREMFTGEYDLTIPAINAVVRLFQEMDKEMYANWREKRWRHFLPVEFAVRALNGLDNTNHVENGELAAMFEGPELTYNVHECRLILAPLLVNWHWCMYAWDFEKKRMVVLDPIAMNVVRDELAEKHRRPQAMMHHAMLECRARFFADGNESEGDWETEYIGIAGGSCESNNTGVYTMYYARYFDGDFMTRLLTKAASRLQKMNILYQMLAMAGNEGDPPAWIREMHENIMY